MDGSRQGTRLRGNASECQVWSRQLDNGGEIYVVMFNNGKGSCASEGNSTMTVTWPELSLPHVRTAISTVLCALAARWSFLSFLLVTVSVV